MFVAMDHATLTPELEQFATEAVAAGRYRDVAEVVQAGLPLLRESEAERAAFEASLESAPAEGERDGFLSAEDVHRRMTAMLDGLARAKA
jgi:putative addiction module CopG family antidote